MNLPSLYFQGSILPGITYIGMMPTAERDQLYPSIFHQPFYNLHHVHNNRNANKFRQESMYRMTKVPTTQTPSTSKPFLSHTSRNKTKLASLPHYIDLLGESACESAEKTHFT